MANSPIFCVVIPKKKVITFFGPILRYFDIGERKKNYIRDIGAFMSYIGFIGNIGAISGLSCAFSTQY